MREILKDFISRALDRRPLRITTLVSIGILIPLIAVVAFVQVNVLAWTQIATVGPASTQEDVEAAEDNSPEPAVEPSPSPSQTSPSTRPSSSPSPSPRPRVDFLRWEGRSESLWAEVVVRPGTPQPGETVRFDVKASDDRGGLIGVGACFDIEAGECTGFPAETACDYSSPPPSEWEGPIPSKADHTYEYTYSKPGSISISVFVGSSCAGEWRNVEIKGRVEVW